YTSGIVLDDDWVVRDSAAATGTYAIRVDGGRVGINSSTAPTHQLTIQSGNNETVRLIGPDGSFGQGAVLNWGDGDFVFISEPFDDAMQIQGTYVGVGGTPTSSNRFQVFGNASKTTAGEWLANSDGRIKTKVETIDGEDALEKILRVRPVSFDYTPEYLHEHPEIEDRGYVNIIAQEFAEVFPEWVQPGGESVPGTGEQILQVDTWPLTINAVAAIQELDDRNRELEQRNEALSMANEAMQKRLEALEAAVKSLQERKAD
ncbi:MAG: tail fiber domain-containing protein, partial [Verrucomicrobiota bacterium]